MNRFQRDFIRRLALALGRPGQSGGRPPLDPLRGAARQAWLDLFELAAQTHDDPAQAQALFDRLVTAHRTALDGLVARGELAAEVAADVAAAYVDAARHLFDTGIRPVVACYILPRPDLTGAPRPAPSPAAPDLARQAALLIELAAGDRLQRRTVNRVLAAIERDIAVLLAPQRVPAPAGAGEAARFLVELLGTPTPAQEPGA